LAKLTFADAYALLPVLPLTSFGVIVALPPGQAAAGMVATPGVVATAG
jgi:hypothetical protein